MLSSPRLLVPPHRRRCSCPQGNLAVQMLLLLAVLLLLCLQSVLLLLVVVMGLQQQRRCCLRAMPAAAAAAVRRGSHSSSSSRHGRHISRTQRRHRHRQPHRCRQHSCPARRLRHCPATVLPTTSSVRSHWMSWRTRCAMHPLTPGPCTASEPVWFMLPAVALRGHSAAADVLVDRKRCSASCAAVTTDQQMLTSGADLMSSLPCRWSAVTVTPMVRSFPVISQVCCTHHTAATTIVLPTKHED